MEGKDSRLPALRRFAFAITVLNLLGHTVLGFEQAWAQLVLSILTAYSVEAAIETVDAWATRRPPRYAGGAGRVIDFLLSPHITGCAVAMLLYANAALAPIAFASAAAIASKYFFRVASGSRSRHFLNPSNFGITATLLLFPTVGIAPPYQFTERLVGAADWILPAVIVVTGTFLNTRFTGRLPLIAGWLSGFVLQAVVRTSLSGGATLSALLPMTGVAFILFTFYMVTDPATTPSSPLRQLAFGVSVAAAYGILVGAHVVFGLFYALTAVTAMRGAIMYAAAVARRASATARDGAGVPVPVGAERGGA